MARPLGFSTGALAPGDCRRGLEMLRARRVRVVELSALREEELRPLLTALDTLDLSSFDYVSVHAPSSLEGLGEGQATALLRQLLPRRWPIVLHPDAVKDRTLW